MDIAGAKALKKRLERDGAGKAPPVSADVDVAEDAPPVYHWVGVRPAASKNPPAGGDDDPVARASLFRRVGLSLR
jgi:hypothetical protein